MYACDRSPELCRASRRLADAQFYVASAPPPPDRQRSTLAALPYLFREALLAWWNDDVPRLGASLAYYTLFAIAPVLLVAIAIAGAVFGEEAVRGEIVGQLDELLGRDGAQAVRHCSRARGGIRVTSLPPCSAGSRSRWPRPERFSSCRLHSTPSGG